MARSTMSADSVRIVLMQRCALAEAAAALRGSGVVGAKRASARVRRCEERREEMIFWAWTRAGAFRGSSHLDLSRDEIGVGEKE